MSKPFIVMINPKTLELASMWKKGEEYRLGVFGDPTSCIGDAYTAEMRHLAGEDVLRIHSPGGCRSRADFQGGEVGGVNPQYQGKGYGLLLYCGVAAGVFIHDSRATGVFSIEGNRSQMAEQLWATLVRHKIASKKYEDVDCDGDDCEEEDTQELCVPILDRYREMDDGWYAIDREVCGSVNVTRSSGSSEETVNLIDGEDILKKDFVLWSSDGVGDAPIDLIMRLKVHSRGQANHVAKFIGEHYGRDAEYAFLDRPDVAVLFGQQALFSGPRRHVGLPPVSSRTRRLLDMFENAP